MNINKNEMRVPNYIDINRVCFIQRKQFGELIIVYCFRAPHVPCDYLQPTDKFIEKSKTLTEMNEQI